MKKTNSGHFLPVEKNHQSAFPLSVIGLAVTCIFATNFASAQPLTIRDDYSDTTSESLHYDQIDFSTGSKANVVVTIGGDHTQSIVLDKGINLDDESGSATVDMTLSADSIQILGGYGINYGTSTIVVGGNDPGENHILNVIADELTVNATTVLNSNRNVAQSALSVNASSTVNLGAEENRISSVTLTAEGTHAVYVGDNSAANVFADSIVVTTNATSSTYAGIYVTGDAAANLNVLNNITINNANGYGIDSYGTGSAHLKAGGSITINAAKTSKAISFRTLRYNNDHAEMSFEGKNIFLTGRVESTGSSSETTAKLTLAAENTISIDAESSSYGAVQLEYRRHLDLSAENLRVTNKAEDGELKGFGFKLDGSGTSYPTVDASFGNEFSIEADTGVYLYATNAAFTASGEAPDQSLLSITGSLAGFVAKNSEGQNRIEDTSVAIVLNKNTAIADKWYGPTGQNGMVGIYNAGGTQTMLQNGKSLTVNISATNALSGNKVIGMLADATTQTGLLTIQNYDLVSLDLTKVDSSATVYGIRSVSSKTELNDIGTFEAKVNSGYAVYASSYTSSSTKYAQGSINIDADSVDVEAGSDATAFYASDGGTITVNAHNQVIVDAEGTDFIDAKGENSKVQIDASEATVRINGDITATGKATASLSFNSGNFTGTTNDYSNSILTSLFGGAGAIHLTLGGENSTRTEFEPAQWNVTDDSVLTSLSMNSAVLNLAWRDAADALSYKSVAVKEFGTNSVQGGSGDIYFNIDLETEAEGTLDQLEAENVSGTYTGHVNFDNPKDLEGKLYTENYLIHQEAGSMQVNNPDGKAMSGDGMMSKWSWKFRPADLQGTVLTEDDLQQLGNTGEGEGDWILVRDTSSGSGEGGTPPESEQIKNLGSSVAQAIGWLSEKNDLRRRLGEVRYGSQAGAWAKVFTRQDRADGFAYNGFKQNSTGVHIGYDTFASKSESSSWLVGATLRYARADQEGIETAYGGNGKTNEYSGKLYATWMHEKGSYLDALVQFGYYDQEIRGRNNSGTGSFDADYHNIGMGASVEIGHMFTLSNGADDRRWFNHWFIEPQLELSYFYVKGQNFKTSTGLKVEQGDADFLTGRAGLVIGKKFNYGTVDDLDRRYFQIGLIGGVNHEFLGDQEIRFVGTDGASAKVDGHGLGGTSFYYGLTADWQVANRIRIYAELDAEEGEHYTKDYGVNVGFKYSFE